MVTAHQQVGPIEVTTDARSVVTVTLRRPDKGNALTAPMIEALASLAGELDQARLLVLRGEGRHFCTGMDVSGGADEAVAGQYYATLEALSLSPCPIVALTQGGAIGAGLALLGCADAVLAAPDSFFSLPETRLGFVPDHLLPYVESLLGQRVLRRYALSGERLSLTDATALGVAVAGFPDGAARDTAAAQLVETLLRAAPHAVRRTKAALLSLPPSATASSRNHQDDEVGEGLASFFEKREPSWYAPPTG